MLTKRTQILFDQGLWSQLVGVAKSENASVGELVRTAVAEKYQKQIQLVKRSEVIESILKHRKHFKGKLDYKALINAGRKH